MWVYEEIIEGKKLTEIINETHENVKYLPGHKLPANVVSLNLFPSHMRHLQKHSNFLFAKGCMYSFWMTCSD